MSGLPNKNIQLHEMLQKVKLEFNLQQATKA